MVCIYCQGELSVNNSRPQKRRTQVWRRRACKACGAVFTSIEAIDLSQAMTVQQTDATSLVPFDRDKLFISLYESLRHRPLAASDARALADTVAGQLITKAEHSRVTSRIIRELALGALQRFDQAAATHYAAFHP